MQIKKDLLLKCKEIIEEGIEKLNDEIKSAQKSANEYGAPKDRYDSFRTQLLRKRDMFAQQLAKVQEQWNVLDRIDPEKKFEQVEFGALVITSNQKIFVSTGIGKIEINNETYYAISAAVPIFKAMQGKKAGEEFELNGRKIKIREIL